MIEERPSKAWIVIIVAIISTAGLICAAIIGLGLPFSQKMAENYFATNAPVMDVSTATQFATIEPTSIAIQPTSAIISPTSLPISTETIQDIPIPTVTPDCWQTVWSFNPSSSGDINTLLSPPRTGYNAFFDTSIYADSPGSLRIETTKIVEDPMKDANAWTWMNNTQAIVASNGLYRVVAMIKTQDVMATHISIVGRDKNGMDVSKNGTNQVSVLPVASRALYGTNDWNFYASGEFNPKEWSDSIEYIMLGVNAGWSSDGTASITWFDDIQLQFCNR